MNVVSPSAVASLRVAAFRVAVTLAVVFAPLQARADGATTLSGVVADIVQRPLAGASVSVVGPTRRTVLTDEHGAFAIDARPGPYTITITKVGYRTATLDAVAILAGQAIRLRTELQAVSLSSLAEIGRVATGRSVVNTSTAAIAQISGDDVLEQGSLELKTSLNELPGIISSSPGIWRGEGDNGGLLGQNGATPATVSVAEIRGALDYETESLIDGHPVTTGRTGSFNNAFLSPYMLQDVQVVKGPGAVVPNINNAVGGAVNFRTLEPTAKNLASADVGTDGHGTFENLRFTGSTLGGRLSYAVDYATQYTTQGISVNSLLIPGVNDYGNGVFVNGAPAVTPVLTTTPTKFYGVSAYGFGNAACCSPLRSFLASQNELAKVRYAFSPETSVTTTFLAGQASYDPEATAAFENQFLLFVPPTSGYGGPNFAPTCCIRAVNQNPVGTNVQNLVETEFRTTFGDNAFVARYYQTGTSAFEATAPGPSGSITIDGPLYGSVLLNGSTTPTVFDGRTATISTKGSYEGLQDVDELRGYTVEFDHPVGDDVYSLTFDRTKSTTYAFENYSAPTPSETIVPGCSGQTLTDAMLRGRLALSSSLSALVGIYYTRYTNHYTQDGGATYDDATHAFLGPRIGTTWHPDAATSVRFAAGSSIAPAYVYLLTNPSGPPIPNDQGNPRYYTRNMNAGDIAPETAFGYDLGVDRRVGGFVVSGDVYETTLHGQFLQSQTLDGTYASNDVLTNAGVPLPLYDVKTSNLGTSRYEGLELAVRRDPVAGFGGRLAASLMRAYVVAVPAGFYDTAAGPNTTNLGVIPGPNFFANGQTYNALAPARVPYAQGYAEATFRAPKSVLSYSALGVTFYGNNNAYNEPPFFVVHASVRLELAPNTALSLTGDNLTGQYAASFYSLYGGIPVPLANGQLGATSAGNYGPPTYRITLHHRF